MKFYRLLKYRSLIHSRRLTLVALYALFRTGRRFLGVYLDPVLACNLQCRMCYFSEDKKNNPHKMSMEEYEAMAGAVFHRTLKLQLGCGAEPTLVPYLSEMVRVAKERGVPFVSVTSNGQLLAARNGQMLRELVDAGLDELILSLHGTEKLMYEQLMTHASFERFEALLALLAKIQQAGGKLQVRVNYTINADNFLQLRGLPELLDGVRVDALQLRPIQNLGSSAYKNFDRRLMIDQYDNVFPQLVQWAREAGVTLIYPTRADLKSLEEESAGGAKGLSVMDFAYLYASPEAFGNSDFDYRKERFEEYARRTGYGRRLLQEAVRAKRRTKDGPTVPLNYHVK